MAKKTVKLTEATAVQLATFAQINLGLDNANHRLGGDKLRAMIATAGYQSDEIEIDEADPALQEAATQHPDDRGVASVPKEKVALVKIRIPAQSGPGGSEDVRVAVNGVLLRVRRNTDVEVPIHYVEALENAQKAEYDKDENGSPVFPPRMVPTHPFYRLN